MIDDQLRAELLAMRAEDLRVRQELADAGELGGRYVPGMEAVHVRNAERLKQIVALHGWPGESIAGDDGAKAAWFIVQHAIGDPQFQRESLLRLRSAAAAGDVPKWHAAYLDDRIAVQEGRPQRYGTQWIDDPADGRTRPCKLEDEKRVNEFRAEVGLGTMHPIPELGPELSKPEREALEDNLRWWTQWLATRGWR
jgi:hypothetical protein